jgi:hypothetical protein
MENLILAFELIETVLAYYYCFRQSVIYWELTDAEENVRRNGENRVLGSSVCIKLYNLTRFVNEISKYLLKTSKCLLNFVGACHMGFLLGEPTSVNRNISTKEMVLW